LIGNGGAGGSSVGIGGAGGDGGDARLIGDGGNGGGAYHSIPCRIAVAPPYLQRMNATRSGLRRSITCAS
jgi:hypothetical protein